MNRHDRRKHEAESGRLKKEFLSYADRGVEMRLIFPSSPEWKRAITIIKNSVLNLVQPYCMLCRAHNWTTLRQPPPAALQIAIPRDKPDIKNWIVGCICLECALLPLLKQRCSTAAVEELSIFTHPHHLAPWSLQ